MKKTLTLLFSVIICGLALAQPAKPYSSIVEPVTPDWGAVTKSAGDSCGTYFNNYIGLQKTTNLYLEYMRTGTVAPDNNYYNGRAQRFTVSQPVEVSGVEFYAYHESATQDSVMVITALHSYDALTDSLGPEITRDTCYVHHTAFTATLPDISVQSYFDAPVAMSADYVIAMHSNENEELIIVTNDYSVNDGAGEGLSFAKYDNPMSPGFEGWYSVLGDLSYDYDYLMNPLVKFDIHNSFSLLNDTICPDMINAACVNYTQVGNFSNHLYNQQSSSPSSHLVWLWGDGFQNTDILMACHTYNNPGTFNINLKDTLFRHDFNSPYCIVDVVLPVVVLDAPVPSFTFLQDGMTVDFTNTSTNSDSVWWDFGDASAGTDLDNPSHTYSALGTFSVWLHSYNMCYEDSVMQQVTTDDVGIETQKAQLVIYPNPASANVVVSGLSGAAKVELLNILGEQIYMTTTNGSSATIGVNHLSTGTYFLKISDENGVVMKKIAVKH